MKEAQWNCEWDEIVHKVFAGTLSDISDGEPDDSSQFINTVYEYLVEQLKMLYIPRRRKRRNDTME
jgi:hypothetical protein